MDIRTKGLNHLCFSTYYRGPFVASNIANMYCTECIIGIIQNAGTPPQLRFARTRRDEGGIEPPVLSYILQRPIRSVQYCEYVLYRMYYRYHSGAICTAAKRTLRPGAALPSTAAAKTPVRACRHACNKFGCRSYRRAIPAIFAP